MSFVFVVDQERKPLDPIHPGRARFLLKARLAAVLRRYPFTVILKESKPDVVPEQLRIKIDPGSKTTGLAIVNDQTGRVVWAQELVKFDTQLMQDPNISAIAYQQGTLQGYEMREYLLLKWGHICVYCQKEGVPLQIEHLIPKSRGGSSRQSNLTLACQACNQKKGDKTAIEFGFPHLMQEAKKPLKDVAAVNTARWTLYERLKALRVPVEIGTGGKTKYNRSVRNIPKNHWLDAACVGDMTPGELYWQDVIPLLITATGRHSRQMCHTNEAGFPDKAPKATSVIGGFRTGDIVRAVVTKGKKVGTHVGRIAIRATGFCNVKTKQATIQGIHVRYCFPLHRADGYNYQKGTTALPLHS